MIIGILQTGRPPGGLIPEFGGYSAMLQDLIGPDHNYRVFDVEAGELPKSPRVCETYVITGSSAGAYDNLPWIAPLEGFLRAARGEVKLVGVCFGHQIMAQAFGGVVEKSAQGWGAGLQTYDVWRPAAWMVDSRPVAVAVAHQDQVTAVPPGAQVLGGNAFTSFGLLAYDQTSISMQCHPEFSADFAKALFAERWAKENLAAQAEAAIRSLDAPNDRLRVGDWIRAFLAKAA